MNDFLVATREFHVKPQNVFLGINVGSIAYTVGSKGNYYSSVKHDRIFVYHAEKVRNKSRRGTVMMRGRLQRTSTPVRKRGWKIRVFAFPAHIVKSVKQEARHFRVELDFSQAGR